MPEQRAARPQKEKKVSCGWNRVATTVEMPLAMAAEIVALAVTLAMARAKAVRTVAPGRRWQSPV